MKICAALAWYDESPEFLQRCVSSLAGLADDLVALDGAWGLFEQGEWGASAIEQRTVRTSAEKIGIPDPYIGAHFTNWESQVAKRAHLMELASQRGDWILVIDGDEYVTYSEPDTVRRELKDTEHLCAYAAWKNLNQGETMPGTTPASGLNRRLFKAGTTVRIVHSGYFYEGENVLVGDALDLRHCLAMEHDNVNRGVERNARARSYRRARAAHGVETWVAA